MCKVDDTKGLILDWSLVDPQCQIDNIYRLGLFRDFTTENDIGDVTYDRGISIIPRVSDPDNKYKNSWWNVAPSIPGFRYKLRRKNDDDAAWTVNTESKLDNGLTGDLTGHSNLTVTVWL